VRGDWWVDDRRGHAAELHAAWPRVVDRPEQRAVAVCRVSSSAVVLGSTQSERVVDGARAAAAGVSVVNRRSGGGAVLVAPGDPVWVDVYLPRRDPLWRQEVDRAFDWLGDAWVEALGRSGLTGLRAHREGYRPCTRWSSLVCFGGVGTGEVVTDDGRKVVGLAQRRTRLGAWFHGACVLRWDPARLVDLLDLDPAERQAATDGLRSAVVGAADLAAELGCHAPDAADLAELLIDSLP
jgi:lipoate-protein ligase A